jgi:hypothetical protein
MTSCASARRAPLAVALTVACGLLFVGRTEAAIRYVDNIGTCDGLTPCDAAIQDAVDASAASDFVEVFPGIYRERIFFDAPKDHVVLRAHAGTEPPVILPPTSGAAVAIIPAGVQVLDFVLGGDLVAVGTANALLFSGNLVRGSISMDGCAGSSIRNNVVAGPITNQRFSRDCNIVDNISDSISFFLGEGDQVLNNVIRGNTTRVGGIDLGIAARALDNTVESNVIASGGIHISGDSFGLVDGNAVVDNVVRGGPIDMRANDTPLGANTIIANVVTGSPEDGIVLHDDAGGSTTVSGNTSLDNAGCDINDTAAPDTPGNTWQDNHFRTKCGAATE